MARPRRKVPQANDGRLKVWVAMGSESDFKIMEEAVRVLREFGIPYEIDVTSAHRSPEVTARLARDAEKRGIGAIILGAGHAAHLAGVVAAHTTLPVIGVPLGGSPLQGFDSLLSTVQMPPGVPVATVGVGPMGARNAGHLAAAILALSDRALRERLKRQRRRMTRQVLAKGKGLPAKLRELLKK